MIKPKPNTDSVFWSLLAIASVSFAFNMMSCRGMPDRVEACVSVGNSEYQCECWVKNDCDTNYGGGTGGTP